MIWIVIALAGLVMGVAAALKLPKIRPVVAAPVIGNVVGWAWYAVHLARYETDAQDGIAVMFLSVAASVAAYAGNHGCRLWKWFAARSGRSQL
ncbi:hypothetical protein [Sandarakinorhabdus sp.]|uniref:hypothetical protein n=1 Tax=Sandarakinorhabdus sp. TaxID=1916663 RepID=UPI003564DC12